MHSEVLELQKCVGSHPLKPKVFSVVRLAETKGVFTVRPAGDTNLLSQFFWDSNLYGRELREGVETSLSHYSAKCLH